MRQWFNTLELQETLAHGRAVVEKDLQRHGQTALNLDKLTHEAGSSQDDFFVAAGRAEVNSRDLDIAIRKAAGLFDEAAETASRGEVHTSRSRAKAESGGIPVVGVDKLMTGSLRCKPVPPDPIVGFVTRLKGITIHRADCSNVQRMMASEPNRIIDADWGDAAQNDLFSVQIDVIASDRQGLLRHFDVLARENQRDCGEHRPAISVAKMKFTAEVRSMDQLRAALVQVAQVKGVQSARRV